MHSRLMECTGNSQTLIKIKIKMLAKDSMLMLPFHIFPLNQRYKFVQLIEKRCKGRS